MYYILDENFLLRGWEKLPFALADRRRGRAHFFRRPEMEALLACDGHTDSAGLTEEQRAWLEQLCREGVVRECPPGTSLKREQRYRLYPARYIRTAHWSVTGRCNYRCRHCYMSAPDAKYGELSHETVMDIARQIIDCGIFNVSLTGGEALVRRDFMDIVDALTEGGVRITTIYSNGRLVTDKLLDALEARGLRPEFNMSFDGVGWHDWLRGVPGAEQEVDAAFRRCRDRGFPTGAEMCIHAGNRDTLRATVNHLRDVGCGSLKTNPIADAGTWHDGGYGQSISMDELFQIYLDYVPYYYADGMPLSLLLGGFFSATPAEPERYDIAMAKSCGDPSRYTVCGHARQVMYISPEGRALPCTSLAGKEIQKNYPLITEIGLQKAITESAYMDLIDTRASKYFEHNPGCAACEYARLCIGGCRASALETTPEDILGRDEAACRLFRGGWAEKLQSMMSERFPHIKCAISIRPMPLNQPA